MADLTFGLGVMGLAILGIILLVIPFLIKGMTKQIKSILTAVGVIALILALLTYAIPNLGGEADTGSIADQVDFDVTVTEAMSHVTFDDATNTFVMACSFDTSDAAFLSETQYFEAEFLISWANGPAATDGIAKCNLGTVALVPVDGAADEYIIDQNADKSYKALWTKASNITAYEDINVLVLYGGESTVTLNVTLNAAAMAAMEENEMVSFTFTVGGEMFTVNCLKDVVQA